MSRRMLRAARRSRLARVLLMLLCLAATPCALRAQMVSGVVRDSASQQPLPGAAVLVLDPTGRPAARGRTDQQGRFRLSPFGGRTPRRSGALRLRVLRMGFRPHEIPLAGSGGRAIEIELVSFPIVLEEVVVVSAPSCPQRPDRPAALALLQQVRTALYATVIARSQSSATITRLLYARRYDDESGRIAGQTVRSRVTSAAGESFDPSRSASAIGPRGFREDVTGFHSFIAPDAETVVDESFMESHCYRLMPPESTRPRQVGLGFEPGAREDTGHVDIAGTLWVDTLSRVLKDLSFRYVGLDRQTSALAPQGRLSFRELANGVVLIDRWSLRLAGKRSGGRAAPEGPDDGAAADTPLSEAQEIGGEIARASWPDGYGWSAPLGTVRLRAVDRHGQPVPASIVQLAGAERPMVVDSAGRLELRDLLPGPYSVSVRDPRLADLDIPSATAVRFVAIRDSAVDARIEVETVDDQAARRCAQQAPSPGRAWLLGRAVGADGRPVLDARWTLRDEFGALLVEGGRADGGGVFQWCQLPAGKGVSIDVSRGDRHVTAHRIVTERLTTLRVVVP